MEARRRRPKALLTFTEVKVPSFYTSCSGNRGDGQAWFCQDDLSPMPIM